MRVKTTLLAALAALVSVSASAGDYGDIKNSILPPPNKGILKSADIGVFGMYLFDSDDFSDTYGYGGSLGWKINNLIGLKTEYWYAPEPQLHNAALNAVLQIPVGDTLSVRPFIGVGFLANNNVRGLGQAGIDLLWSPQGSRWALGAGYRYVYVDGRSDYQGTTLGIEISF